MSLSSARQGKHLDSLLFCIRRFRNFGARSIENDGMKSHDGMNRKLTVQFLDQRGVSQVKMYIQERHKKERCNQCQLRHLSAEMIFKTLQSNLLMRKQLKSAFTYKNVIVYYNETQIRDKMKLQFVSYTETIKFYNISVFIVVHLFIRLQTRLLRYSTY